MAVGRRQDCALLLSCLVSNQKFSKKGPAQVFEDTGLMHGLYEGVELLVQALSKINQLQDLDLSNNEEITTTGWKAVSTLLELPDTKLGTLKILHNNIGDEEALVFANALSNNSTLKRLDLDYCRITERGWASFSKLLWDTSTVNGTYLSNHTLQYVGDKYNNKWIINLPLALNRYANKPKVAAYKIVEHHSHINMEPFFEWEFKVLPIMVSWFAKAANCTSLFEHEEMGVSRLMQLREKIQRMRLSATFDFIKEFPMLYVEPMTRKEIAEYTAMEEQLHAGDQTGVAQLEEIRRCKARAMGRLVEKYIVTV